jgi:asparagine synthase (glutamine-hydrolysing)
MCGICGIVEAEQESKVDERLLHYMTQAITHRGPDDDGYFSKGRVGLGMRRLSIIDLVTGDQPVSNEDGSLWVVFNGEIYNYKALYSNFTTRGHSFYTQSDTEVIVHAYEEYGVDCPKFLNGMFAIALWDEDHQRLLLARDHLGIKPLYYWLDRDRIIFGSELKSIILHPAVEREIDLEGLDQFLTLEYIPAPRTIFKNIHKLPAGHRLIYQNGQAKVEKYWDIPDLETPKDEGVVKEILLDLIDDAVKMQLMSDVPLGAFLSGGIDSSSVVASMSKSSSTPVQTFSIGFDDTTYNELPYARSVARKFETEHTEEILDPDIVDLVEKLVPHLDEPFGDFSIFPTYLVSEVARRQVKVVLSGDGGDEIFGGYDTYVAQAMDSYYRFLPAKLRQSMLPKLMARVPPRPEKKGVINKTKRFIEGAALPSSLKHTRWMMFISETEKQLLYRPDLLTSLNGWDTMGVLERHFEEKSHWNSLSQQQYVDIKTYLVDDILTKVDRMSMAVSLEARVPLLDYRIVEFAVNLPEKFKITQGETKKILKQAMSQRLPYEVLNKPKQGFSIPLKHWLRDSLKPMMLDLLSPDKVRQRGYFNEDCVAAWVDQHLAGEQNHSHRLWALMVFEIWHQQFMDSQNSSRISNTLN